MKLKIVVITAVALFALAGGAQAAGLFDNHAVTHRALLKRATVLMHKAQRDGQASISRARRGPRGFRGPRGLRGAQGAAGPKGSFSSLVTVKGPSVGLDTWPNSGAVGSSTAVCPAGMTVTGGGWQGGGILETVGYSAGAGGSWTVIMINNDDLFAIAFNAVTVCAS